MTDSINHEFDVSNESWIEWRRFRSSSLYVTSFTVGLSIESNCEALYFRSSNYSTKTGNKHMLRVLLNILRVFVYLVKSNIYGIFTINEVVVPSVTTKLRWIDCRWRRNHDFVEQMVISINQFNSSQPKYLLNYKHYYLAIRIR